MNKEISDSLYFLLHCALKDDEFETQREQFEIIYKYIENLERENQELKAELELYKNGVYFSSEVDEKDKEIDKLKKQLEEYKENYQEELNENCKLSELWCDSRTKIRELENQQKEFIEYMENEINKFKELEKFAIEVFDNNKIINIELAQKTIEENNLLISNFNIILSKYKEIIGGKDE